MSKFTETEKEKETVKSKIKGMFIILFFLVRFPVLPDFLKSSWFEATLCRWKADCGTARGLDSLALRRNDW
jgi:hypothetical protein